MGRKKSRDSHQSDLVPPPPDPMSPGAGMSPYPPTSMPHMPGMPPYGMPHMHSMPPCQRPPLPEGMLGGMMPGPMPIGPEFLPPVNKPLDMCFAHAYVPWQRYNGPFFSPQEALKKGTIFPELYQPYVEEKLR